jgi:hypothetical protein
MFYTSAFDEFACVPCGITVTNPAMVARIRAQSAAMSDYEIAAHLGNAIASSTDAAHALAWEQASLAKPAPKRWSMPNISRNWSPPGA